MATASGRRHGDRRAHGGQLVSARRRARGARCRSSARPSRRRSRRHSSTRCGTKSGSSTPGRGTARRRCATRSSTTTGRWPATRPSRPRSRQRAAERPQQLDAPAGRRHQHRDGRHRSRTGSSAIVGVAGAGDAAAAQARRGSWPAMMRRSRATRPVLDVPHVELEPVGPVEGVAAVDLRPAGDARPHVEAARLARRRSGPGSGRAAAGGRPRPCRRAARSRATAARRCSSPAGSDRCRVIRSPSASGAFSPGRSGRIVRSFAVERARRHARPGVAEQHRAAHAPADGESGRRHDRRHDHGGDTDDQHVHRPAERHRRHVDRPAASRGPHVPPRPASLPDRPCVCHCSRPVTSTSTELSKRRGRSADHGWAQRARALPVLRHYPARYVRAGLDGYRRRHDFDDGAARRDVRRPAAHRAQPPRRAARRPSPRTLVAHELDALKYVAAGWDGAACSPCWSGHERAARRRRARCPGPGTRTPCRGSGRAGTIAWR